MKIQLFPVYQETLVVAHDWDVLISRIEREIDEATAMGAAANKLIGWVKDDAFQLAIRVRRTQFFMPVVNGRIDPTTKGSLLFLSYSFFPATRFFLLFWAVVLPLIGAALSISTRNPWYFPGFAGIVAYIFFIAWSNFRIHLRTTRSLLHAILS